MTQPQPSAREFDLTLPVGPQILRRLRGAIIANEFVPGTRISEAEIGLRYGVSRQPVREVFIKLAEEGLVAIRPQRGTFVRKIGVNAVLDARFVREAIEADIVAACAQVCPSGLVETLRAQIAAQQAGGEDPAVFMALDDRFHRTLAEGAGRATAWGVIDGLKSQMDRVRQLTTSRMPTARLVTQHAAVVDAIEARDPQAAIKAMRGHLQMILSDLPAIQAACPQFFDRQTDTV